MLGLEENEVSLYLNDYQYWNRIFEVEQKRLAALLKEKFVAIEHVGSTSIPSMIAKPIIDIAIGVHNLDTEDIKRILSDNGYEYRAQKGSIGRLVYIKTIDTKRTHHIHIEVYGSESWNNHINFRNCLRNCSELRDEYAKLKQNLAAQYPNDRKEYTSQKVEFIKRVLSQYNT